MGPVSDKIIHLLPTHTNFLSPTTPELLTTQTDLSRTFTTRSCHYQSWKWVEDGYKCATAIMCNAASKDLFISQLRRESTIMFSICG